jgi:Skp family chaperone for outer membrane proteins
MGRFVVSVLLCASLASCAPASTASDPSSVGRAGTGRNAEVDVSAAILNCRRGKAARERLRNTFDSRQADLDRRQDMLKALRQQIEDAAPSVERDQLVSRWKAELADLQARFERYNRELKEQQDELTKPIFEDLMRRLPELAEHVGAHAVYDKHDDCKGTGARRQCIPWGRTGAIDAMADSEWLKPRVDLTNQAIQALDE